MWQKSHFVKFITLVTMSIAVCTGSSFADDPYTHTTPFIDPFEFDPDFQLFKPFDPDTYGGPPKPRVGWFFNYDRMYIAMSRPSSGGTNGLAGNFIGANQLPDAVNAPLPEPIDGNVSQVADTHDFTYGNRIDVGFMTEEDHGWLLSFVKVNNPNVALVNTNFTNGNPDSPRGPTDPLTLPNITVYGDLLGDWLGPHTVSINAGTFNSVELMKIFRTERLHNDVVVEPMVGMRYIEFRDDFFANTVNFGQAADPNDPNMMATVSVGEFDAFSGSAKNDMIMGQVGFRASGMHGPWQLGAQLRAFGGLNYQIFQRTHRQEIQTAAAAEGGDGDGGVAIITIDEEFPFRRPLTVTRDEFEETQLVFGTEMRADASYFIWRDVAINVGFELILAGRGVARGFDINNDESLMLVGGTLGIVVNR